MDKATRTCMKAARARSAKRFATETEKAFAKLNEFVERRCRHRSKRELDKVVDELANVVDTYIELTSRMMSWCQRNNVPVASFTCDVVNEFGQNHLNRRS